MRVKFVLVVLTLALATAGARAQTRKTRTIRKARTVNTQRKRPVTDMKGTGASVYDLDADLPEDIKKGSKGITVSVDTVRKVTTETTLIPFAEVDAKYQFNAEASSPLNKVEIADMSGNVMRTIGLHNSTKASIDLNAFPKDQTLNFKFYGANGQTQTIEMSH